MVNLSHYFPLTESLEQQGAGRPRRQEGWNCERKLFQLFPTKSRTIFRSQCLPLVVLVSVHTQLQASLLFSWSILRFALTIFERTASIRLRIFIRRQSCLVCGLIYNVKLIMIKKTEADRFKYVKGLARFWFWSFIRNQLNLTMWVPIVTTI